MAVSAVPALIDALVANADAALSAAQVLDGVGATDEPGDYLMVGVDDPDGPQNMTAASSQQSWATAGMQAARDEEGDITCVALSWNGDGDQKAARDAAFATCEAVATLLRANPSQGVDTVLWTSYGTDHQLTQAQDENGAAALIFFQVHFRARI